MMIIYDLGSNFNTDLSLPDDEQYDEAETATAADAEPAGMTSSQRRSDKFAEEAGTEAAADVWPTDDGDLVMRETEASEPAPASSTSASAQQRQVCT